jgi:uncharacterized membrane protein YedE/YeeE
MQIDWTAFTPGPALFGGVLLGIAAALYIHFHGRILGISGIVSGLLRLQQNDLFWRICFVLGLLTASFWAAFLFDFHPSQVIEAEWGALILAGLLVGFGARLH